MSKRIFGFLKNRYVYLSVLFVAAIFTIIWQLFQLQIVNGQNNVDQAKNGIEKVWSVEAPRGNIYDRNGTLIATNRTAYTVKMVYVNLSVDDRNKMYLDLMNLFEKNGDVYVNDLGKNLQYPIDWGKNTADGNEDKRSKWFSDTLKIKQKSIIKQFVTPQDVFNYMRKDLFNISDSYSDEDAYKIMVIRYEAFINGELSPINPILMATDVCANSMVEIESRYMDFPGVYTDVTYFRQYINPQLVSHVLGYVRAINADEYNALKDKGYLATDVIGKDGIEKGAEDLLRGQRGMRTVFYDTIEKRIIEVSYEPPVPGNDVYLTIDLDLQNTVKTSLVKIMDYLNNRVDNNKYFGDAKAGSVVATNPQTGEILAMVSYPDYDNSVFLEPSTNAEAQAEITSLFQDSLSPTMNRATFGLYPPGSAFKLATSLAGLESNSITPGQTLFCSGQTEFDGQVIKCLGIHGNVDMEHALAQSCNSYFTQLGVMTGIANIDKYTKMLGLGEKTGVEISELQGYRNNQETMKLKEKDKYHIWGPADTAQSAIGQLYNLFTPIQLNRYVSAVTTGYITTSHLIYKAMAKDGTMTVDNKIEKTKLDVQESSLQAVRKGMLAVANWGSTNCVSAYSKFPKNFVLAKTGTPETGEEKMGRSSHSIFVCAAPSDDPQIAVSIVIEHGSWGGESAPISADIFNEYFDFNGYTVPQPSSRPDGLSVVG